MAHRAAHLHGSHRRQHAGRHPAQSQPEVVPPPKPKNNNEPQSDRWSHTIFSKIIHSLTYAGYIVWGLNAKDGSPPVIAPGRHGPIVTKKNFKRAGKVVAANAPKVTHPRQAGSSYMMSRMVRCRMCGKNLVVSLGKHQAYKSYECSTRKYDGVGVCDCPKLKIDQFEEKFLSVLLDDILCPSYVQTAVAKTAE